MTEQREAPQPDLLYGAEAIAAYLGITAKQVYYLHDIRSLPTFKIGSRVCARRSALDQWLDDQARGTVEGGKANG